MSPAPPESPLARPPTLRDVSLASGVSGVSEMTVSRVLRGKHRPTFTTNIDTGDFVIVINAEKVALTGSKLTKKFYYAYSGTIGGLRKRAVGDMLKHKPEYPVEKAVKGMLPHNSLGRAQGMKLKVYAGTEHPHAAQQPVALPLQF